MFKIHKSHIITTSIAVVILGAMPVMAQLGNILSGGLGDISTDFEYYTTDLKNYLTNNSSDTLNPVELQTQSAISNSLGDLQIPNSVSASKYIYDQIVLNSVSDKFENNPAVYGLMVGNEVNRYITRASAESILGTDGQSRLKNKLQSVKQIVDNADRSSQQAEAKAQLILTFPPVGNLNDPMGFQAKAMQTSVELELQSIKIQKDQSKIMAEALGRSIQSQNDLQNTNLNLANISQQLDGTNRAKRAEGAGDIARLLRTTAQTDLFRKSANFTPLNKDLPASNNNPSSEENNIPPVVEQGQ